MVFFWRRSAPGVIKSRYKDVEIPSVTLTEFVLSAVESQKADKPCLIDGPTGRTYTYGQVRVLVKRVASGLRRAGVSKGDVVAIHCANVPEFVILFHAVAAIGAINTTINPAYTPSELKHQLKDSGATILFTMVPLLEVAAKGMEGSRVERVYALGLTQETAGVLPFAALMRDDGSAFEFGSVQIDPQEDLVALPYSSGTTGVAKGVALTHRNLVANLCQLKSPEVQVLHDTDVVLGLLPFFHIYGLNVIMNGGLVSGCTIVTLPKFEPAEFLGTLEKYQVTMAFLVPPLILFLAKHPIVAKYKLGKLKLIMSGAAPLGPELCQAVSRRLKCKAVQGYGMTEMSPVSHAQHPDDNDSTGSVGFLVPNTVAKLVDVETGKPVGPKQRGELWVKGPQVMKGYWNKDEATRETIDADGFIHTGDVAVYDEKGRFTIVDRVKELIKYKGFQVPPAELEALLVSNAAVADAAVVPVPDEEAGEVPKAFVVRADPNLTEKARPPARRPPPVI
eukprot:tig00000042_g15466.t1